MTDQPVKMKACKYCGKSLPEEAIFCYYCHRELLTRPERPAAQPKGSGLNWLWIGLVIVLLIGLLIFWQIL
jgi:predicted nucleic acid-binding Zn ribbon protein